MLRTLTPCIMVRILVAQPRNLPILYRFLVFRLRRNSSGIFAGYRPSITMDRCQRRKIGASCAQRREVSLRPLFGTSHLEHCIGWRGIRRVKIRGAAAAPANRVADSGKGLRAVPASARWAVGRPRLRE